MRGAGASGCGARRAKSAEALWRDDLEALEAELTKVKKDLAMARKAMAEGRGMEAELQRQHAEPGDHRVARA